MDKDDREECEWEWDSIIRAYIDKSNHKEAIMFYAEDIEGWKYCPYCGKPIKIKGDK